MDIDSLYQLFSLHPHITTDSRNILVGSIFFALRGDNFNGNLFAEEALLKGAAFAVVDDQQFAINEKIILVDDVLVTLQRLATYHRIKLGIKIISITGTNGKTTTKELIAAVLTKKFKVNYTKGNLNNHIGVPITLLAMNKDTEIGVIEMGANHPGEIKTLCEIARPDFGLVTNMGKAHLEGFGSFDGVVKTKSEMYDYLRANNGKCFVHAANSLLVRQAHDLELITYGNSNEYDMPGELASTDFTLVVKALFPQGWLYLRSKLIGDYNYENLLAAACVGHYFGVDPLLIQEALAEYTPSNNRSQLINKIKNTIVMDAYNANPSSMKEALINFAKINNDCKCLILGDMLELGEASADEHQTIANLIESLGFDHVFLVGTQFATTSPNPKTKKFDNAELLSNYLKTQPIENKLVLIKGSRGIKLEKILDVLA